MSAISKGVSSFKVSRVVGLALVSAIALSGCATGGSTAPMESSSSSAVSSVAPLDANKILSDALIKSIDAFKVQGGSQAVHVEANGVTTTNIVAVNPSLYSGMVRLTVGEDGKVTDPRADETIYTQLNLINDLLAKDASTLNLKTVGDIVTYQSEGLSVTVYLIDGKVTKIVSIPSDSSDASKPSKVTHVYAYGDSSYNEAIKIIADAVAKSKG